MSAAQRRALARAGCWALLVPIGIPVVLVLGVFNRLLEDVLDAHDALEKWGRL